MQSTFSAKTALLVLSMLLVASCGKPPADAAFNNRGPESLLDVSSEVVTLSANSKSELSDLSAWIEKDHPTRAELNCAVADKRCDDARKLLDLNGVPVSAGNGADHTVTLVYERILARDCDQRLVINRPNYHNAPSTNFGCAVSANIVQHVTDKQEFINPNLSDDPRANRAVMDYHRAYTPRAIVQPYNASESIVSKAKSE